MVAVRSVDGAGVLSGLLAISLQPVIFPFPSCSNRSYFHAFLSNHPTAAGSPASICMFSTFDSFARASFLPLFIFYPSPQFLLVLYSVLARILHICDFLLVHHSCHSSFSLHRHPFSLCSSLFLHHQRCIIACLYQRHILQSLTHFHRSKERLSTQSFDHLLKDSSTPSSNHEQILLQEKTDVSMKEAGSPWQSPAALLTEIARRTSKVFTFRSTWTWPRWRT